LLRWNGIGAALLLILLACPSGLERRQIAAGRLAWREMPARRAYPAKRSVYPYSIIRGGAYSAAELDAALRSDPITAAHYAGFDRAHIATVPAAAGRKVYVSYRAKDRIFWTAKAVPLTPGEILLSDGTRQARARCGNRISDTPQQPVAEKALSDQVEEEFDIPEDEKQSSAALSQERELPSVNLNDLPAASAAAAGGPFWLAPDVFAEPAPVPPIDSGSAAQPFFGPFIPVAPGLFPGEMTVRGAAAGQSGQPFSAFPVAPVRPLPAVVFALSMEPVTASVSANWIDAAIPPLAGEPFIRAVPSADPGEVVFRLTTTVPVAPWWWFVPQLPGNPGIPGSLIPTSPPGTLGPAVCCDSGIPGSPFLPSGPGAPGVPGGPEMPAEPVPEPYPAVMVAAGLAAALLWKRRQSRRST
jgi:hypothetical protein